MLRKGRFSLPSCLASLLVQVILNLACCPSCFLFPEHLSSAHSRFFPHIILLPGILLPSRFLANSSMSFKTHFLSLAFPNSPSSSLLLEDSVRPLSSVMCDGDEDGDAAGGGDGDHGSGDEDDGSLPLLASRHYAKCFANTIAINAHNNPVRKLLFAPLF